MIKILQTVDAGQSNNNKGVGNKPTPLFIRDTKINYLVIAALMGALSKY